jgi:hypothetical protein
MSFLCRSLSHASVVLVQGNSRLCRGHLLRDTSLKQQCAYITCEKQPVHFLPVSITPISVSLQGFSGGEQALFAQFLMDNDTWNHKTSTRRWTRRKRDMWVGRFSLMQKDLVTGDLEYEWWQLSCKFFLNERMEVHASMQMVPCDSMNA